MEHTLPATNRGIIMAIRCTNIVLVKNAKPSNEHRINNTQKEKSCFLFINKKYTDDKYK